MRDLEKDFQALSFPGFELPVKPLIDASFLVMPESVGEAKSSAPATPSHTWMLN